MNEQTQLSVKHLGENYEFPLSIVLPGYTYQRHIEVNDRVLISGKDDQENYRLISSGSVRQPQLIKA